MIKKKLIKSLGVTTVAFMGLSLFSCSDSETPSEPIIKGNGDVTIQLAFSVPASSRSVGAQQQGSEKESTVESVSLHFVDDNNNIILSQTNLTGANLKKLDTTDGNLKYSITCPFRLNTFAGIMAGKKIRLIITANDRTNFTGSHTVATYNSILKYGEGGVMVPMSNRDQSNLLDYSTTTADNIKALFTKDNNYTLDLTDKFGTISLERSLARFDLKDGSDNHDGIYKMKETGLLVKVSNMQPVNVAKQYYVLRHTGEADASTGVLFGSESNSDPYIYLVDSDWSAKRSNTTGDYSANFLNPVTKNGENITTPEDWVGIYGPTSLLSLNIDKDSEGYCPWLYVAENTLPGTEKMIQGLSTGVAFKVVLVKEEADGIHDMRKDDIKNFPGLKVTEIDGSDDLMIEDPKHGYNNEPMRARAEANYNEEGKLAFYTLNYFYWVRHNDVSESVDITDPMEFGIVRNHIYKMQITGFNYLPNSFNPTDPDERPIPDILTQDFVVKVQVKPWTYYLIEDEI